MFKKTWKIKETSEISKEILEVTKSEILAKLLLQRGIDSIQKIDEFLNPSKMKISSSYLFTDMQKTVKRIFDAIEKQEKIVIYGDFDADGVTATSLLYKTLKHLNANVDFYIPNRLKENHGLNTKALVNLIAKQKTKLIITVDCGISDLEQVKFANSFNVDVIITDHHEAPEELPNAFGIINPKALNALEKNVTIDELQSLNLLAGVGVAFKLACALLEEKKDYDFAQELLPYVALGTIADVVPILYENRAFVDAGLKLIENGCHYGLTKLLEKSGYDIKNGITSENIAFGVAPRINAAGRLDTVDNAIKLLISENKSEIDFAVEELNNFNSIRQDLCDKIYNQAIEMIQNEPSQESIILYNEGWHIGIIGIVASKLVEKFYKPVFLMTKDDLTGFIRCSARSVPEVHLRDTIAENTELFEYFGGHSQAAGLVFNPQKFTFETIKQALNSTIKTNLNGEKFNPTIFIDLEIDSKDINIDLIEDLKCLEPFGEGNKQPLFVTKNLTVNQRKTMGANDKHLKIFCENAQGYPLECVFWNKGSLNIPEGKQFDAVFYPKLNVFNGVSTIQLDLQDIKSDFLFKEELSDFKFYDHRKKTNIYNQICDYLNTTKVSTEVFSQEKAITENLKKYSLIAQKIRTRKTLSQVNQIMFFDYPASENIMHQIIAKTNAKILHFMNYNNKQIDAQDLIKNVSGMLKYVHTNKDGVVNLSDISDFLSISDETTELCLDILDSIEMIEIISKNASEYKIKFLKSVEFSKIKENEMYDELLDEIQKTFDYREKLFTSPLENIV